MVMEDINQMSKIITPQMEEKATQLGIDLTQLDFNSIILPPDEDMGIPSDDEEELTRHEESLIFESGYGNVIIVDHLPCVPPEKFEKLEGVIRKIFSQIGVIKEDGLWMPVDEVTQKTLGYCFIEFNTPQEAELAKERTHGYKLDKTHIFAVNLFDDIDKFMKVPDQWAPPETKPYTPGENLRHWLTDEKARDQFVIRAASNTEVLWNDPRQKKPELVYSRARVVLNIFDVRTGKLMREFKGSADDFATGGTGGVSGVSWPVFRWAGGKEDKYFARIGKNVISVYETETFTLIDKKSLKVENVMDFSWSPSDPIIALFVPELGGGNQPARVSLVQIPGKEELRQKNLFSVSDCRMYWQSNGDYLAVKVDRYTKTKKSTYTGFELFRIKERDIPIEVLELENKNDKIIAFAWEPKGHRFAVIHGDSPRPDISFYSMRTSHNSGRVSKLTTLKGKQANSLFWSPTGRFILLAGLKGFNGQLEFFNVDELETMQTGEHFMATDVEWDPTGRYVATSVTSVHESMENGFHIWSFNGKLLYRIPRDNFLQFLWRPRPPSYLTAEKEEEIAKNLKKYSKKYEAEDQDDMNMISELDREKRNKLKSEWEEWVKKWKQLYEEEKMARQMLRDGEASDEEEEYEAKEVEVEEVLDYTEEIIDYDDEQEDH
ncbi:hypothetical protein IFM89_003154 [Coptis chinensis]|uniref:Eukaryotic translation initiation factor 3 subunit B n=1 Tax=Coptis chinensis TaxID=261450 RepID=A0A835I991_9MAGN|nr:hypothetical protein IFM89_003154 [Coptis chinensis]